MNKQVIATITALGIAGSAFGQAVMVAGWDFSQYAGANFNVVTNTPVFVDTLSANYSDYDPTQGAGAESAAFGTMYWDGQFGSTDGVETNPADAIPFSGSLTNNIGPGEGVNFDSHTVLDAEGQTFTNFLSFKVNDSFGGGDGDLVFAATIPGGNWDMTDWELKFAARIDGSVDANVDILFSTDGSTYNPVGTATITANDTLFTFPVAGNASPNGYYMLDFTGLAATGNPVIDNVSISAVPEPSTIAFLMGLIALGAIVIRRRVRQS